MIVEVEKPENAKNEAEKNIREKRIAFYERLSFVIHKDIKYSIFGVPMYLMTYSKEALSKEDIINYMKIVYGVTLRKRFQHMLKIEGKES